MRLAREEGDGRALTLGEELLGKQSVLMGGTYVGNRADVEALRLAGLILENESLRLQSAEARLQVMALVLVLAAVLAVVLAGAGILWLRVRRLRLENCALKASIETFGTVSEAIAGSSRDAEQRTGCCGGEATGGEAGTEAGAEIQSVLRDMVALIGEMNEACGRDGDGSTSTVDIRARTSVSYPQRPPAHCLDGMRLPYRSHLRRPPSQRAFAQCPEDPYCPEDCSGAASFRFCCA